MSGTVLSIGDTMMNNMVMPCPHENYSPILEYNLSNICLILLCFLLFGGYKNTVFVLWALTVCRDIYLKYKIIRQYTINSKTKHHQCWTLQRCNINASLGTATVSQHSTNQLVPYVRQVVSSIAIYP